MIKRYFAACVVVGITLVVPLCDWLGIEIKSPGAVGVSLVVATTLWVVHKRSEEWQA